MILRILDPETEEPMFNVSADVDTGSAIVLNSFQGSTVFVPSENDREVFLSFRNMENIIPSVPEA